MKISTTILIAFALHSAALSQWVKTNGPEGGSAGMVFYDPASGYVFVGGSGFYRSSDNGLNWSQCMVGMNGDDAPSTMVRSGSTLFAGSFDKVYVSTNNGDSWIQRSSGLPTSGMMSMASLGGSVVVGTAVYAIYRTTNDGLDWTKATGFSPSNNYPAAIIAVGPKLLAGLGGKGVWASTDSGASWTQSSTGLGNTRSVNSFALAGGKVFASTSDSAILVSTNSGANWSASATGMNFRATVGALATDGSSIYAHVTGAYGGAVDTGLVYRSTDNGASWVSVKSNLQSKNGFNLGIGAGGKVFFSHWAGLSASTNGGGSWALSNSGLANANPLTMTVLGTTLFAGVPGGITRTTDEGATWTYVNNGVSSDVGVTSMATRGSYVFAGTSDGSGILRSGDNGATWSPANGSLSGYSLLINRLAAGGSSVYAGTFQGLYVSTDDGGSWSGPATGLPGFGSPLTIFPDGADVWAGFGSYGLYHSTDNGATWTTANNGLPGFSKDVCSIVRNGSNLFVGLTNAVNGNIYISTDNGGQWTVASTGIPRSSYLLTMFSSGGYLFAGFNHNSPTVAKGVYRSGDNGASWVPVNEGLPDPPSIAALAQVGQYMYGSFLGVWKRPFSDLTGVREIPGAVPKEFSLSQNYPNPFNPATEFVFNIPGSLAGRMASVKIFDVLGQEVTTLVHEALHPGSYKVSWNAGDLSSGIYLCRLQAGDFTEFKKMTLAK